MHEENVKNSIYYILQRSADLDFQVGKTRLIKLLYLLDIEFFRSNQRILSGLDWIFYKHGPYAYEIDDFLNKIGVETEDKPLDGARVFAGLKIESEEEPRLNIEIKTAIEKLLNEWGTADLRELLDYVYFETEPMIKVEFKQKLDFSQIRHRKEEKKIELSLETKQKLKELGKRIRDHLEQLEPSKFLTIELPSGLTKKSLVWEDEILDLSELKGKVDPTDG